MNAIQRAVPVPKVEITKQRALGRQIFGNVTPLASRAQHIHETVHDFPRLNRALPSATFGRWNNRLDVRPLIVRQIARIAQLVTIVFQAVFGRPHWRAPSNQAAANESQMIHPIQLLPGRTLSTAFGRSLLLVQEFWILRGWPPSLRV